MVSVCTYCGVGCEIEVEVDNNQIWEIKPVSNGISSGGSICIKGKYGYQFLKKRLQHHLIRKEFLKRVKGNLPTYLKEKLNYLKPYNSQFYSAPLQVALDLTGWMLNHLKKEFGGKSIAGIGGARTSLENGWLFQKFIRESIGSPHIDNCARVCHAPSLKGLKRTIGEGAATLPFKNIEEGEVIFVIGSNTTSAHPMVAKRIVERSQRGAKLIVVDVRETELMKFADIKVILPMESNLLFLNLLARELIQRELIDRDFIDRRCIGFKEYKTALLKEPISKAIFTQAGFPTVARQIEKIAPLLIKKTIFIWGLGVTEQIDGSDGVSAIANLALLTGNFSTKSGLMPLRGQNNVQGACDIGCLPYYLPDYKTPEEEGYKTPEIMEKVLEGKIKGIINMGEDLFHIHPNQSQMEQVRQQLELLVVLEVMENSVTKKADIVFGVKSGYEKFGVYVNGERRLHLGIPLVKSNLPDDWEVIQELENRLTGQFQFQSSREIFEKEIAINVSRFANATYNQLKRESPQWPLGENGKGTPVLHLERFATEDGKGHFYYAPWEARGEIVARLQKKKSYFLNTGRHLVQYNNSAQTAPAIQLSRRYSRDWIIANPINREELGEWVKLSSKYGETPPLPVKYSSKIRPYTLFTTFHFWESGINRLFGNEGDRWTKTARFKGIEVIPIPVKSPKKSQKETNGKKSST